MLGGVLHLKGSGIVFLRQQLARAGADIREEATAALSPEDAHVLESALASDWVAADVCDRIWSTTCLRLYPRATDALERNGRDLARESFGGIYRFLVRVATVPFLVEQTAKIFRRFYDMGEATSYMVDAHHGVFEVRGIPYWPESLRRVLTGHIDHLLTMTGAKNVRVIHRGDARCWAWDIHWI